MNNFGTEVRNDLMMLKGKSASEITHGLKTLDGGEGILLIDNVIKAWEKANENHQMEISKVRKDARTICFVMLGTVIIGSVYTEFRLRKLKKHDEANQALIKELRAEMKAKPCSETGGAIMTHSDNPNDLTGHDCVIAEYTTTNNLH